MYNYYHPDLAVFPEAEFLGRQLWERSGLGPDDIDVAMLYENFSPIVFYQLEAFGFCGAGEAKDFIADGNIDLDGALPVNTNGGLLGEAYIHGMNNIIEGVRQVRGTAANQVDGRRARAGRGGTERPRARPRVTPGSGFNGPVERARRSVRRTDGARRDQPAGDGPTWTVGTRRGSCHRASSSPAGWPRTEPAAAVRTDIPQHVFDTARQNVHSKLQIIASVDDGGSSTAHCSQIGRSSSMSGSFVRRALSTSVTQSPPSDVSAMRVSSAGQRVVVDAAGEVGDRVDQPEHRVDGGRGFVVASGRAAARRPRRSRSPRRRAACAAAGAGRRRAGGRSPASTP